MKKLLALVLVAGFVVALGLGCGGSGTTKSTTTTTPPPGKTTTEEKAKP